MHVSTWLIFAVLAAVASPAIGRQGESSLRGVSNVKIFEPTHEWKVIEDDEQLPGGLWIRIDLTTGKKEARLLD
ncbi:Aste57867_21496 [Aphanomyces stellatus]|uniref:Aste57867_21496 protein n=1 Tax=Aphanomyces stellatus TaxID=120398 RepID=A0A485LJ21_9STRA|nr:hypothetical protein As57867_021427 [Aphanomyces stellatus]VFT98166.1 Aste57867_21496 [Aphanomyces stellatus]